MSDATEPTTREERYVEYLLTLAQGRDRGPLAALRRGLGKEPSEAPEAYRYVVPWLDDEASRWDERCYFAIAALLAWYPDQPWRGDGKSSNLGASFRRLANSGNEESAERRFVALLKSHRDDLPVHLRQAISLLRAHQIPVDWGRLLRDIRRWSWDGRPVQREWARAFWGAAERQSEDETEAGNQPASTAA